ncbi:C6 transcription factor [Fusarium oxysporum f. sp. phaseoli]
MDEKWNYMRILVDIANMRAMLPKGKTNCHSGIEERMLQINHKLGYLEELLARSWGPVPVWADTASHSYSLDGHYDVYPSHYAMQVYNAVRSMRLEMEELIRDRCQACRTDASDTINEIARQICHTVPQYIISHARPENAEPFTPMQKLQCKVLLALLYQAAQLSTEACIQ